MKPFEIVIDKKEIEKGQQACRDRAAFDEEYKRLSDPIITGFAITMKALGYHRYYDVVGQYNRCHNENGCNSQYVGKWMRDGIIVKACAECGVIFQSDEFNFTTDSYCGKPLQDASHRVAN